MPIKKYDVVIIGGGITGLSAAYRLTQKAPQLKIGLFEASGRLGGKIQTERVGDFVLEAGADSFLSRKPRGVGLCTEMGVDGELIGRLDLPHEKSNRAWVKRYGELHPLPEGLTGLIPTNVDALETTTLLSAEGKKRIAEEPHLPAGDFTADESVGTFITRRLGREAYENIVEPLMSGIYAADGDQMSILSTFPQLRAVVEKRGSLIGGLTQAASAPQSAEADYAPFVSFEEGMDTLIDHLVERLDQVDIQVNEPINTIRRDQESDCWELTTKHQQLTTKSLIVTTPANVNGRLLADIDSKLANAMDEIPYAGTVLVNVGVNVADLELPEGYGYVIPRAEQRNVLACTWSSEKWPNRAPEGKRLIRVYIGRYGEDDVCAMDDHTLIEIARKELIETLGLPENAKQLFMIHRWPDGLPQYTLGHQERLAQIDERVAQLPGVAVAGCSYRGVGIPDCIKSAEAAAEEILAFL
ncbi:MAG: protoporphyrinogen oxidase [Anaerolineae bacterium]